METAVNLATLAAAVASAAGLLFVAIEAKQLGAQSRLANDVAILEAHNSVTERAMRLDLIFFEHPEMHPYFHAGKGLSDLDEVQRVKVMMLAEYLADFFESILVHSKILGERGSVWEDYCVDLVRTSPALRNYFDKNLGWYSPDMVDLLRRCAIDAEPSAS